MFSNITIGVENKDPVATEPPLAGAPCQLRASIIMALLLSQQAWHLPCAKSLYCKQFSIFHLNKHLEAERIKHSNSTVFWLSPAHSHKYLLTRGYMLDTPLKVYLHFPLANSYPSWSENAAPKSNRICSKKCHYNFLIFKLYSHANSYILWYREILEDMNAISMNPLNSHFIMLFVLCLCSSLCGC